MQLATNLKQLQSNAAALALYTFLDANSAELGIEDAIFYQGFPWYRDEDERLLVTDALLVSPRHGLIAFATFNPPHGNPAAALRQCAETLDQTASLTVARLLKLKSLRSSPTSLSFDTRSIIYAPSYTGAAVPTGDGAFFATSEASLLAKLVEWRTGHSLAAAVITDIASTIDGAKGLIRPKPRELEGLAASSLGVKVRQLELEIAAFDERQKKCHTRLIDGPQRIRGLAGSGKTVVLAVKAALLHLREPNATILFTFFTRSLYQHIKRLITRFYRQFDDRDPDWTKIRILHAWGGEHKRGRLLQCLPFARAASH